VLAAAGVAGRLTVDRFGGAPTTVISAGLGRKQEGCSGWIAVLPLFVEERRKRTSGVRFEAHLTRGRSPYEIGILMVLWPDGQQRPSVGRNVLSTSDTESRSNFTCSGSCPPKS